VARRLRIQQASIPTLLSKATVGLGKIALHADSRSRKVLRHPADRDGKGA